jgi:tRNA-dihydrouridine synthase B
MRIGPYEIDPPVIAAPMAGVSDRPFRVLCRRFGAGLAVSEMTTADPRLWATRKSRTRMDFTGEPAPISVQIAGSDPQRLAEAARHSVGQGAQIIDINMGCPAKKVCGSAAGSALLRDEPLAARIIAAVVGAVSVPVTLKIRTGYTRSDRNAVRVAKLAESLGIAAIAVHGRTREEFFEGEAEYQTIAEVKSAIGIPVVVNGDIGSPQKAREVLALTGADAVMIGREAQGRPWIFRDIAHYLATGERLASPTREELRDTVLGHLQAMHEFYGEPMGVRIARKHLGWYSRHLPAGAAFRAAVNQLESAADQRRATGVFFNAVAGGRTSDVAAAA